MPGRSSRTKGCNAERELVHLLTSLGFSARRVPLSGSMSATGFAGDVLVKDGLGEERWEVKRRSQGFKKIYDWLSDASVVAVRSDRNGWIVCMRLEDWSKGLPAKATHELQQNLEEHHRLDSETPLADTLEPDPVD